MSAFKHFVKSRALLLGAVAVSSFSSVTGFRIYSIMAELAKF